ncbi:MAG TPA: STAS/SEC14 domain-containing protein [Sandaracinaceae bacterium LLY-WYZ-13_1]|nr:STAS/SEC14 domain-containing protein [Sandaracinaceae bacterium LLY-WYZ-13_1]
MLSIRERTGDEVVVDATGKLDRSDYERLVPQLEHVIDTKGGLRLMVCLRDFHGWTPKGLLEDLRFDLKHRDDFERVAIVGEREIEKIGTQLSKPFFSGEMRFFQSEATARQWLEADAPS